LSKKTRELVPIVRATGEFYAPVVRQQRQALALLAELQQPSARVLPRHEHARAYLTLVLEGDYAETCGRQIIEARPLSVIYNPAGVSHASQIGRRGTRLFTIDWTEHAEQLQLRLPEEPIVERGAGALVWPSLRLFSAFRNQRADHINLEADLAEIFAVLAGRFAQCPGRPRWLRRAKERMLEEFRSPIRILDLARDVGVHPVHLARVFRRCEGQTPAEYLQRVRVRAACDRLREGELPLARVAVECGFADQSHLTRTLKRTVGATPDTLRKALAFP
jgi:AraC family transcriptional regulator